MFWMLFLACSESGIHGDVPTDPEAGCTPTDELCDGIDNDCDTLVDEDALDAPTWFYDYDQDGWGGTSQIERCEAPEGALAQGGDCLDSDPNLHPDAPEICDDLQVDEDCDGLVNQDDPDLDPGAVVTAYADADGDGWGAGEAVVACSVPEGSVQDPGDCNDGNDAVFPGALETCFDDVDSDCDGTEDGCAYPEEVDLDDTFPTLWAEHAGDFAGAVIASDDMNADGHADLIIGATIGTEHHGAAYLALGPFSGDHLLAEADTTMRGWGYLGYGASVGAADLTGDGAPDMLVGANGPLLAAFAGPIPAGELTDADADWILEVEENLGTRMHTPDVNGDGQPDLLVGDVFANQEQGEAYLFYGPITGDITEDDAAVTWTGTTWLGGTGMSVDQVGDVDGDGVQEIGIGAPWYWNAGDTEALYVASGIDTAGGSVDDVLVRLLGPTNVVENCGQTPEGDDLDGDGYSDVIVGCPYADGTVGYVAVAYGPLDGTYAIADLADRVVGAGPQWLGWETEPDDFNADGVGDLLIGAPGMGFVYAVAGPFEGSMDILDVRDVTYQSSSLNGLMGFAIEPLVNDGESSFVFGGGSMTDDGGEAPAAYIVPAMGG